MITKMIVDVVNRAGLRISFLPRHMNVLPIASTCFIQTRCMILIE